VDSFILARVVLAIFSSFAAILGTARYIGIYATIEQWVNNRNKKQSVKGNKKQSVKAKRYNTSAREWREVS
jgi:hypothetical protein